MFCETLQIMTPLCDSKKLGIWRGSKYGEFNLVSEPYVRPDATYPDMAVDDVMAPSSTFLQVVAEQ